MGVSLTEIAQQLIDANKKVQLIYAFNGTGKTRLSREFKQLIAPKIDGDDNAQQSELAQKKVLYYSAFTEDLFYWDNDLTHDAEHKLKIHQNSFTKWVFEERGQDRNIVSIFQHYTNEKLTPNFSANFSEVTFSFERGNNEQERNVKISKGEESNFVWSVFFSLIREMVSELNIAEVADRSTDVFNNIEYVFIDDPVSSLDENHLIELAVDLAELIKSNASIVKFIIATHNPLFFNVLDNELGSDDKIAGYKAKHFKKYRLDKNEDGTSALEEQPEDSSFSYHLYLKSELEKSIESGQLSKYHFNYLRNILEKTTIFLGYKRWGELLPQTDDGKTNPYEARMMNLRSHSRFSGEEVKELDADETRVLKRLISHLDKIYKPDLKDAPQA